MKRNIYFIAENENDIEAINDRLNEIRAEVGKHSKAFKISMNPEDSEKKTLPKESRNYYKKGVSYIWKISGPILRFLLPSKGTIAASLGMGVIFSSILFFSALAVPALAAYAGALAITGLTVGGLTGYLARKPIKKFFEAIKSFFKKEEPIDLKVKILFSSNIKNEKREDLRKKIENETGIAIKTLGKKKIRGERAGKIIGKIQGNGNLIKKIKHYDDYRNNLFPGVYGLKPEAIKNHYQFFLPEREGEGVFITNDTKLDKSIFSSKKRFEEKCQEYKKGAEAEQRNLESAIDQYENRLAIQKNICTYLKGPLSIDKVNEAVNELQQIDQLILKKICQNPDHPTNFNGSVSSEALARLSVNHPLSSDLTSVLERARFSAHIFYWGQMGLSENSGREFVEKLQALAEAAQKGEVKEKRFKELNTMLEAGIKKFERISSTEEVHKKINDSRNNEKREDFEEKINASLEKIADALANATTYRVKIDEVRAQMQKIWPEVNKKLFNEDKTKRFSKEKPEDYLKSIENLLDSAPEDIDKVMLNGDVKAKTFLQRIREVDKAYENLREKIDKPGEAQKTKNSFDKLQKRYNSIENWKEGKKFEDIKKQDKRDEKAQKQNEREEQKQEALERKDQEATERRQNNEKRFAKLLINIREEKAKEYVTEDLEKRVEKCRDLINDNAEQEDIEKALKKLENLKEKGVPLSERSFQDLESSMGALKRAVENNENEKNKLFPINGDRISRRSIYQIFWNTIDKDNPVNRLEAEIKGRIVTPKDGKTLVSAPLWNAFEDFKSKIDEIESSIKSHVSPKTKEKKPYYRGEKMGVDSKKFFSKIQKELEKSLKELNEKFQKEKEHKTVDEFLVGVIQTYPNIDSILSRNSVQAQTQQVQGNPFGEEDEDQVILTQAQGSNPFGEEDDEDQVILTQAQGPNPFGEDDEDQVILTQAQGSNPFGEEDDEDQVILTQAQGPNPFGEDDEDQVILTQAQGPNPFGEEDEDQVILTQAQGSNPFGEEDDEDQVILTQAQGPNPFGEDDEDQVILTQAQGSNPSGNNRDSGYSDRTSTSSEESHETDNQNTKPKQSAPIAINNDEDPSKNPFYVDENPSKISVNSRESGYKDGTSISSEESSKYINIIEEHKENLKKLWPEIEEKLFNTQGEPLSVKPEHYLKKLNKLCKIVDKGGNVSPKENKEIEKLYKELVERTAEDHTKNTKPRTGKNLNALKERYSGLIFASGENHNQTQVIRKGRGIMKLLRRSSKHTLKV